MSRTDSETNSAVPDKTASPAQRPWQLKLAFVWGGELFSLLTSSVLQMGLIWHISISTGSASMLSLAALAGFLPLALLGPLAGAIVDRISVKTALVASDLFIAAVSTVLALVSLAGPLPIPAILVALFLLSFSNAFYTPAAQSLTPLVAPPQHLTRLAGIQQSAQSLGYIAGTALAAVIYPLFGLTAMIALDVVGALIATAAVLLAKIETPAKQVDAPGQTAEDPLTSAPKNPLRAIAAESLAGLRVLRTHTGLYALLWCGLAFSLIYAPLSALFPNITMEHFGGGTTGSALVEMAFGIGMIAGGALLAATGGFKNRAVSIVGSVAVYGAACLVSGLLGPDGFWGFLVCSLVMGLSAPWYSGPQVALMQERVPAEFMGRVFGLYSGIMSWAMPIGLAFSSLLVDSVGTPTWFALSGAAMIVLAALAAAIPAVRNIEKV